MNVSARPIRLLMAMAVCVLVGGCSGISIEPACPEELRVEESGPVFANAENEGEIATFKWEVFPAGAGTFTNAADPDTMFRAVKEGAVVIRLTASDGLFMVISECSTLILPAVEVLLDAGSTTVEAGQEVTLTCTSTGDSEAVALAIEQVSGEVVALTDVADGVVAFTPSDPGTLEFLCVGEDAEGTESDPASLMITVTEATNDNDNTSDGNTNANDNTNDNDNAAPPDNGNDNTGGGRPPSNR